MENISQRLINNDDQRPRTFALGIWLREIIVEIKTKAKIL
jgi:hypothetical protein